MMRRDDRAAATTLAYVLSLGIATILISGLLIAGGSFVDGQQKQVVRTELRVIGQQVASDLATADRAVRAGSDTSLATDRSFPDRVAGDSYLIEVTAHPSRADTYRIFLNATDTGVSVEVLVRTSTPVSTPVSISGGSVRIVYDSTGSGELVVSDD